MRSVSLSPRRLWWLMAASTVVYYAAFAVFPGMFLYAGVQHFGVWFLDTFAILASNDAVTRGLDPYAPNPLDYFQRVHVYPHWWLGLSRLGLGRGDVGWLGLVQVGAFFLAAVAGLRPQCLKEMGWYLLVLCSSPLLLLVDRANNDIVVFLLLAPVVPCLLDQRRLVRLFPAFLVAIATGLKFYPAVAGLVLLAGAPDAAEVRRRVFLAALLLVMVGINVMPDLARMGSVVPKAEGLMTFGLVNLLSSLGIAGRGVLLATVVFAAAAGGAFFVAPIFRGWEAGSGRRADWLKFMLAAALLTGCYLTGTNYAYRWVFSLWLAPFLWNTCRDPAITRPVRRFALLTTALLVVMLWTDTVMALVLTSLKGRVPGSELLRWANGIFLIEQPLTLAFFACLLGWLTHFVRENLPPLLRRV